MLFNKAQRALDRKLIDAVHNKKKDYDLIDSLLKQGANPARRYTMKYDVSGIRTGAYTAEACIWTHKDSSLPTVTLHGRTHQYIYPMTEAPALTGKFYKDPTKRAHQGLTPFLYACKYGDVKTVELMIASTHRNPDDTPGASRPVKSLHIIRDYSLRFARAAFELSYLVSTIHDSRTVDILNQKTVNGILPDELTTSEECKTLIENARHSKSDELIGSDNRSDYEYPCSTHTEILFTSKPVPAGRRTQQPNYQDATVDAERYKPSYVDV